MESTTVLSIAAVVCFVVYYEMVTSSYIEHVSVKGIAVSGLMHGCRVVCGVEQNVLCGVSVQG